MGIWEGKNGFLPSPTVADLQIQMPDPVPYNPYTLIPLPPLSPYPLFPTFNVHLIMQASPSTTSTNTPARGIRHKDWVKISHWIITLSFLSLAYTGVVILMCHPRLYWG